MRTALLAGKITTVLLLGWLCLAPMASGQVKFAGAPVKPGEEVRANVPLSDQERSYTAEGGNTPPPYAVAVLAVPPGFDPHKPWPVLIPISTDDFKRKNRDDLRDFYRTDALAQGWVVLAGDGPEFPKHGTTGWRAGTTLAALDALHRSFPGSQKWPLATAGYSGGSKQSGFIAPLLALAGYRMIGIYLTGINVDTLSEGYKSFGPGRAFLHTPVFISGGQEDKVAPIHMQNQVRQSLQQTGFDRVRLETFRAGHVVKRSHIVEALRWFRAEAAKR